MADDPLKQSQLSMNLDNWLCRIRQLHDKDIDMGLERITVVADAMGLRRLNSQVILIAGTNGKGTTSRFLEAYLRSLGLTVGVFNSPALFDHTEMVRINGRCLDAKLHIDAFEQIWQGRGEVILTEFEFSTLAALYLFSQNDLDYVLLEVGMGGRNDSTNVVVPDLSVITTIAIDHQGFLGDTREAIGYQKAGIFRPHQTAVVGDLDIPTTVLEYANVLQSPLICAKRDYSYQQSADTWCWHNDERCFDGLSLPKIPLQNVATAIACLHQLQLPLSVEGLNEVISRVQVEGRFECLSTSPWLIVDVAHNVEAAQLLRQQVLELAVKGPIYVVLGMLKDKDIAGVLGQFEGLISRWYVCPLETPRAAPVQLIGATLEKLSIGPHCHCNSVSEAIELACEQLPAEGLLLVFGSFFTVAEAKMALLKLKS